MEQRARDSEREREPLERTRTQRTNYSHPLGRPLESWSRVSPNIGRRRHCHNNGLVVLDSLAKPNAEIRPKKIARRPLVATPIGTRVGPESVSGARIWADARHYRARVCLSIYMFVWLLITHRGVIRGSYIVSLT